MVGIHAMMNNYSMNSCERDAIYAHLYAYIVGNLTREVNNAKMFDGSADASHSKTVTSPGHQQFCARKTAKVIKLILINTILKRHNTFR